MPTLLIFEGFRFFFFSGDRNEPPHVHVKKGAGDGKIWLEPVTIEYLFDFKVKEEKRILEIVHLHKEEFLRKWYEYFK